MRCLDHIDMAVLTNGLAVVVGAAAMFAYLGIARAPLGAPTQVSGKTIIQEELGTAVLESLETPGRLLAERARAQEALGRAVLLVGHARHAEDAFISDTAAAAAGASVARRELLEGMFKLPADWKGPDFASRVRRADTVGQERLGTLILARARGLADLAGKAEGRYGRAFINAVLARDRVAAEPVASLQTMVAASAALEKVQASAPVPVVRRDPAWGFGSIGDGGIMAIMLLGGVAAISVAAWAGLQAHAASTRTVSAHCDTHGRDFLIEMLVSDETAYEVTRCSAFNGGPVTCDKHCLTRPFARAA